MRFLSLSQVAELGKCLAQHRQTWQTAESQIFDLPMAARAAQSSTTAGMSIPGWQHENHPGWRIL